MNLRLPIALSVVAVAAAATAFHAVHRDPAPFATTAPSGSDDGLSPVPFPARRAPTLEKPARLTVYVAGRVLRPGVYALAPSSRAVDAVRAAGGAAADADPIAVNLAEHVSDGQEIVVPVKGAAAPPESESQVAGADATSASPSSHAKKRHRRHRKRRSHHRATAASTDAAPDAVASADADAPSHTVDLNTADESELEALPGIGSSLAERIVAFREVNGPFTSADDLLDVGGMTQNRLDVIAPYVTAR